MGDFTFTFLGTGTSQGIPVITCDCPVCRSGDPRDRRTRASAYVETPDASWVIDTGPDFRHQALREGIRKIDAVLLTHAHTDHIMGFDDLRPFSRGGRKVPVYASAETMDQMRRVFGFLFDGTNRFPGYLQVDPHIVDAPFLLGKTSIVPLPVPHGQTTTFGFLCQREGRRLLAYVSDCKAIPPALHPLMQGVEVLVVDALRHREHPTHMNVAEALAISATLKPRRTLFTHLCHEVGHAALQAELPPGIEIAHDGLRLVL